MPPVFGGPDAATVASVPLAVSDEVPDDADFELPQAAATNASATTTATTT